MFWITVQIPQLGMVLYLNHTSLDPSSTIQNLKNIINTNDDFAAAVRNAGLMTGINYTLTNSKTNTPITQDDATLSALGIQKDGAGQWPKIILRILNGGGRKRSARRRRRSSKRRSRRKKRTRKRRTKRRTRRKHTRRKRKKGKC